MRSYSGRAGDAAASLYLYGFRERRFPRLTRESSANLTLGLFQGTRQPGEMAITSRMPARQALTLARGFVDVTRLCTNASAPQA
jgi:hypothetical protein